MSRVHSELGLSACLYHIMEDRKERPIAYASKCLTSAEKNYFKIEREGLSIVFRTQKFRHYLLGRKFRWRIDQTASFPLWCRKGHNANMLELSFSALDFTAITVWLWDCLAKARVSRKCWLFISPSCGLWWCIWWIQQGRERYRALCTWIRMSRWSDLVSKVTRVRKKDLILQCVIHYLHNGGHHVWKINNCNPLLYVNNNCLSEMAVF